MSDQPKEAIGAKLHRNYVSVTAIITLGVGMFAMIVTGKGIENVPAIIVAIGGVLAVHQAVKSRL